MTGAAKAKLFVAIAVTLSSACSSSSDSFDAATATFGNSPLASVVSIDSDRTHLQDDAKPYLRRALEDVTAGRAVREAETKAMGCALNLG